MNTEQLERANAIKAEIKEIKRVLDNITKLEPSIYENRGTIQIRMIASNTTVSLIDGLLPVPTKKFVAMYVLISETKIAELEKEFSNL